MTLRKDDQKSEPGTYRSEAEYQADSESQEPVVRSGSRDEDPEMVTIGTFAKPGMDVYQASRR